MQVIDHKLRISESSIPDHSFMILTTNIYDACLSNANQTNT